MAEQYYKVSDLPVGSKIVMGKNKFTGKYQDGTEDIVWVVLSNNHSDKDSGYPDKAVTMITEKVIRYMAFDAREPTNTNAQRKVSGNNRYLTSNIRQWLNSNGNAGQWFTPQNIGTSGTDNKDLAPMANYILNATRNYPYDVDEGFMKWFNETEKAVLLPAKITTVMPTESEGGVSNNPIVETMTDYFYLPSLTEITGLNFTYNVSYPFEGVKVLGSNSPIRNPFATNLALLNGTYYNQNIQTVKDYIFRSTGDTGQILRYTDNGIDGTYTKTLPYQNHGIRPMTNIKQDTVVARDLDGTYRLVDNAKPYVIIESVSGFELSFKAYDYDDTLKSVSVEINGEQTHVYNINGTLKEYANTYVIPFNKLTFGDNRVTIKVIDNRSLQSVKTLNVNLAHKEVISSGDSILTKDGQYTVIGTNMTQSGATEIILDRNLATKNIKTDVVEKYDIKYIPYVSINSDFKQLPIYEVMKIKSVDYNKVTKTAIEEWEKIGFGTYCNTKIEMTKPEGLSQGKLSKISQIFTYDED